MNTQDAMQRDYEYITHGLKTAVNPTLDEAKEKREVLVSCECDERYLVWLNGDVPIPNHRGLGVLCPYCQRPIEEVRSLAGHSAGVFNAGWGKY